MATAKKKLKSDKKNDVTVAASVIVAAGDFEQVQFVVQAIVVSAAAALAALNFIEGKTPARQATAGP